jgi:Uma2 family endonuclease
MVVHTPARRPLLRWPINMACPTAEKLYDALTVPPGFRLDLVFGGVRINHPDHRVDDELHSLAARLWDELPKGYRMEIYAGAIVVSGQPNDAHNWAITALYEQISRRSHARAYWIAFSAGVIVRRLRVTKRPDLMVIRHEAVEPDGYYSGSDVPLVIEVTSYGAAEIDRTGKRAFYTSAKAPLYLIVDLEHEEVVLFSEPADTDYATRVQVALGEPLELPDPFGLTLDTSLLTH